MTNQDQLNQQSTADYILALEGEVANLKSQLKAVTAESMAAHDLLVDAYRTIEAIRLITTRSCCGMDDECCDDECCDDECCDGE